MNLWMAWYAIVDVNDVLNDNPWGNIRIHSDLESHDMVTPGWYTAAPDNCIEDRDVGSIPGDTFGHVRGASGKLVGERSSRSRVGTAVV